MATLTLTATFTRLKDQSWGLRVNGPRPTSGAAVIVAKKDGSTKAATIGAILWHGIAKDGREASLCALSGGRDSAGNRTRNGDSYRAGVRAAHGRTCPECGSRECAKAWDLHDLCDED